MYTSSLQLSPHFTLKEFMSPDTPIVPVDVLGRLKTLVEMVLEPLRSKFGVLLVSSGYRSEKHNFKVGGVKNSQHRLGEAADIVPATSITVDEIFRYLIKNEIVFDQAIHEIRVRDDVEWLHVSYTTRRINRQESFIKKV